MVSKVKSHDFACRCSDKEARRCDAVMNWTLEFLSRPNHQATRETLLTDCVYKLTGYFRAEITGIMCDQWCAVLSSTYGTSRPPEFTTFIECDQVEDGIAFTLKAYYDKFKDSRKE